MKVTFRIPISLLQELDALAESLGVSRSDVVRMAINHKLGVRE